MLDRPPPNCPKIPAFFPRPLEGIYSPLGECCEPYASTLFARCSRYQARAGDIFPPHPTNGFVLYTPGLPFLMGGRSFALFFSEIRVGAYANLCADHRPLPSHSLISYSTPPGCFQTLPVRFPPASMAMFPHLFLFLTTSSCTCKRFDSDLSLRPCGISRQDENNLVLTDLYFSLSTSSFPSEDTFSAFFSCH